MVDRIQRVITKLEQKEEIKIEKIDFEEGILTFNNGKVRYYINLEEPSEWDYVPI